MYDPPHLKKHKSRFIIAFKHFPTGLVATAIGIAFLSAPFLYNFLLEQGIDSVILRVLITGGTIGAVPLFLLYLVTFFRAGSIRNRIESAAQEQLEIISNDLEILQAKEIREEKEVTRLEQEVQGDRRARKVKEEKEDERWALLSESLRVQSATAELASEERLLVAQHVKDIKDEGEVTRKELVSDDLKARLVKDDINEMRWKALYEQLHFLEKRNEERNRLQVERDNESLRILTILEKRTQQ